MGVQPEVELRFVRDLQRDLASGEWDRKYGLRTQPYFDGALRLIVSR